jgi:hypothetical protein
MNRQVPRWTRVVLIALPLTLMAFDAAVLVAEWRQSDAEKAIRMVHESKSRKENFTVQQYLYATVYHRREEGEAITIEGWHAEPDTASAKADFLVSFAYTDAGGRHVALWQANLQEKQSTSKNQEAEDLSW